ncbi:MAG TPA: radical SAM protein [Clostridia bacterium]
MEKFTYEKTDSAIDNTIIKHHFLSEDPQNKHRKIHLPVSPVCNIKCKFCKMSFDNSEINPYTKKVILKPEEAVLFLDTALKNYPDISSVCISGPGDALATSHALDTFELVHKKYPNMIKCLGTNGLMLKENALRIVNIGITEVSVTVNAVHPEILQTICSHIVYNGSQITDKEASLWLLLAQLSGIKKLSELGVTVKINTVLIPGVNDDHIDEIARITAGVGASHMNIIPLIPQSDMKNITETISPGIYKSIKNAEKYLTVIRYCNNDVCGIPRDDDITDLIMMNYIETAKRITV